MDRIRKKETNMPISVQKMKILRSKLHNQDLKKLGYYWKNKLRPKTEKKERLKLILGGNIPNSVEDYSPMCQNYLTRNPESSEFDFIKLLLQYIKIQFKAKKLPATFFTVTHRSRRCSLELLQEKLLKILQ